MFRPPYCPNRRCSQHHQPAPRFYQHFGSYRARCRPHPIRRFRCKTCRKSFSRQTFRMDYRDHRPSLNGRLFQLLASGIGLRQASRMLGLSRRCTELKARKIGRHLRRLNLNLREQLPPGAILQFDELETYEGRRNTRPLSVPVLIERESRFLIWAESAPIRPRGKMSEARKRAIAAEDAVRRRKDLSRRSIRRTLKRGATLAKELALVPFQSDEKSSYPGLAARAFGKERLVHATTNSKVVRMTWNPLFPVNHTEAMARDLMGRLRRDSWLVTKKRRYLDIALHVFIAYRNYVRPRFNRDRFSPAQMLGFLPRRLTIGELLSWRQEAGQRSLHPLARRQGRMIERWTARAA